MCRLPEIEKMKRELASHAGEERSGPAHRGRFSFGRGAQKAAEDWAKQFQKDEVPEEIECVDVPLSAVAVDGVTQVAGGLSSQENKRLIRLQKLMPLTGLAASNTEATTKYKQGAVELVDLNGQPLSVTPSLVAMVPINEFFVVHVGRRMKKVRLLN